MFTIIYLLSIAVLTIFSWLGNAYGLLLPDGSIIPNILSQEGIRWMIRHSIDNITCAPLAEALLALIAIGALRSSGLWSSLTHREARALYHSRHALHIALFLFFALITLVIISICPGGNLLSVTGHIARGPFASGWIFLTALAISIPSIVFGLMSRKWKSRGELFAGVSSEITSCADYFVVLVVASQLTAAARYIHLFEVLRIPLPAQSIICALIYFVPLIVLFTNTNITHDTSTTK